MKKIGGEFLLKNRSYIFGIFLLGMIVSGGLRSLSAQEDFLNSDENYQYLMNYISSAHQNEQTTNRYPPDFQVDDLVFFDSTYPPGRWNVTGLDHIAIYLGNDSFICTTKNKTTHAREVNIVTYDTLFHNDMLRNPRYARVMNTTSEQRHNATYWMIQHIKDKYQTYDPRKIPDPVCYDSHRGSNGIAEKSSWAAYYNTGIDIDRNGWDRDFPSVSSLVSSKL